MEIALTALFIFSLRLLGVSISTVRVLLMTRGMRLATPILGFFEVLVYVVAVGKVVEDLNNLPNLLSYCLGFSAGTLLGMWLEGRMAVGFATVRVISPGLSYELAEALRKAGHGVTEGRARGKDGLVSTVKTVVRRREVENVCEVIGQVAPNAFITIEETRRIEHGYLRATRHAR